MAMAPLHSAVGIGIVKCIPNPWISLPLAFLSHIFIDLYPEWYPSISNIAKKDRHNIKAYGWKEWILGITQISLTIVIIIFLTREKSWIMLAAVIAANLMDVWDSIYNMIFKENFWFVHKGWFPFKRNFPWSGGGMRPLQTATLDSIFVLLLVLI